MEAGYHVVRRLSVTRRLLCGYMPYREHFPFMVCGLSARETEQQCCRLHYQQKKEDPRYPGTILPPGIPAITGITGGITGNTGIPGIPGIPGAR